jgi:hypothetical protein
MELAPGPAITKDANKVDGASEPDRLDGSLAAGSIQEQDRVVVLPFDLNLGAEALGGVSPREEDGVAPPAGARSALVPADGRLNKEATEQGRHKQYPRGIPKFAAPLKRALLCNPPLKPRTVNNKKDHQGASHKCNITTMVRATTATTVDEQANALLLKAIGILGGDTQKFGEQFVSTMSDGLVCGMRAALGLPVDGEAVAVAVLAHHAEDAHHTED